VKRLREADVIATRILDRTRRAWLVGRIRVLAFWKRTTVELDVAPDLRVGRGVVVKVAPRSHLRIRIGPGCRIGQDAHLYLTGGTIDWAAGTQFRFRATLDLAGEFRCGERVVISYGCTVHCVEAVTIGPLTGIGEYATIADSAHFHTEPDVHVIDNTVSAPVRIGTNVFLAPRSQISRGVTIGDFAMVGPNSVVIRDVPPGVFVSGVPAEIVRKLELPWEHER
jgi:acetyltransferase-like isoleucine patch superfamily enzyme